MAGRPKFSQELTWATVTHRQHRWKFSDACDPEVEREPQILERNRTGTGEMKSILRKEQRDEQRFRSPRIAWALAKRQLFDHHRRTRRATCPNHKMLTYGMQQVYRRTELRIDDEYTFIPSGARCRKKLLRGTLIALSLHSNSVHESWGVFKVRGARERCQAVPITHVYEDR
jgi:hypothetical protein